jgi:hypothetical protein
VIELGFEGDGETGVLLSGIEGVAGEQAALEGDLTRQVGGRNRLRTHHKDGSNQGGKYGS